MRTRRDKIDVVFGKRLRGLRQGAGLTQKQFGDKVDQLHTEVSRYEKGIRPAKLATLCDFAKALDIKLRDLVDGIDG